MKKVMREESVPYSILEISVRFASCLFSFAGALFLLALRKKLPAMGRNSKDIPYPTLPEVRFLLQMPKRVAFIFGR
jgi:hypothetical protein